MLMSFFKTTSVRFKMQYANKWPDVTKYKIKLFKRRGKFFTNFAYNHLIV